VHLAGSAPPHTAMGVKCEQAGRCRVRIPLSGNPAANKRTIDHGKARGYHSAMPANRQHLPRVERENEIIDVAVRFFTEIGFSGTSMSAIAREVGLAVNAVAWYFPDKDDLLLAALQRPFEDAVVTLGLTVEAPDLWVKEAATLDGFAGLVTLFSATHARRRLLPVMYSRALHSQSVADFVARHDALLSGLASVLVDQSGVGRAQRRTAHIITHQVLVAAMITHIGDDDRTVAEHLRDVLHPAIALAGGVPPRIRGRSTHRTKTPGRY
jgi:AcrR family transcriptional regulator